MRLLASELAAAARGRVVGDDVSVDGAAIDSRALRAGQLFVPVVGERDGHDFVAAAIAAGAPAYLTSRRPLTEQPATAIAVADTGAALLAIGGLARERLTARVVAITGSVGKTSVKDLTAGALGTARRVTASPRSFNNELGVPLTLVNADAGAEVAVLEMGARGIGHIALLCEVVRPHIGVVTSVVAAHTEMFGSVDAVARAKGELVEALPADGTAILNADNEFVAEMATRTAAAVVRYGRGADADITAAGVEFDDMLRASFTLHTPWGKAAVRLAVSGDHQVDNALAAAGAALACGVGPEQIAAGLATATLSPWRMELQRAASGALVINDAYNANPTSMTAALRALAAVEADRRTAVVGLMAELGAASGAAHRDIAALAATLGIRVIAVGTDEYGVEPIDSVDAVLAAVGPLGPGDAVLVKGSRVAGLERVAHSLVARP